MPSLLIYGKGGESESIVVSKENIIEKVPNNTKTGYFIQMKYECFFIKRGNDSNTFPIKCYFT